MPSLFCYFELCLSQCFFLHSISREISPNFFLTSHVAFRLSNELYIEFGKTFLPFYALYGCYQLL